MKKLLILILAFALLVCLCACGSVSSDPTNAPTGGNSTEPTNGNMQTPTDAPTDAPTEPPCTHAYEEAVTKEPTCVEVGEKTFTCAQCGDSYTEEVALVDHTWADATCLAPKTCSVCNATEGDVADHNYQDGVCTDCGLEQDFGTLVGKWRLDGLNNSGTEYEIIYLTLEEDGTASFSAAYYHPLHYETQEQLEFILANGYYIDGDEYYGYFDIQEYNGKYYHSAMYGHGADGTYEQNGNVITVDLVTWAGRPGSMTLRRVSETVLQVVSVDEVVGDDTITECIINGETFTWGELPEDEE